MKKRFLSLFLLLLVLIPFQASADFQFTFPTDRTVTDVMLMGDDNSILGTVAEKQTKDGLIYWTLNVATGGADSGYIYTKNEGGDWIRGTYLSGISLLSGQSGGLYEPILGADAKPWETVAYTRRAIDVRPLGEEQRVQSRCGPAKTYHGAGAYKTYKMLGTDALFVENGYVLVDLSYQTVGKRIVYFPTSAFYSVAGVPEVTLTAVAAYTTADLTPAFGPGGQYDGFDEAQIASGTQLQVFFEENGWVFAEFACGLGAVRAWVPVENVGY